MEPQESNWSELCPELLSEIANRLGTRPNVYNFREVCKDWRFSFARIPRNLPHLSPLFPHRFCAVDPDFFSSLSRGTLHHLIADAVYLIRPRNIPESTKPWLVTVEEFYRGKLCVRLPLSGISAKGNLPANVHIPNALNLSDFHVSVIARGYTLRSPGINHCIDKKLVMFGNPACFEPLSIKDYTALVRVEHGRIAWVRLSQRYDWGCLSFQGTSKFDDIVNFKKRVYTVDRMGRVYVVHYDGESQQTLKMECIVNDTISSGRYSDRRKRLVVDSSGVLYMVERDVDCGEKIHFKVYRLDEGNCKLDEVIGIGDDRILFVGVDWCFFASVADFPGFRGNCIFFLSGSFPSYTESSFRGASKELEVTIFHFEDGNAGPISAFPGYSDILWPPSAWFNSEFSLS
ncbi:hypothetical protein SOVF_037570 [Spinacia oleracea]|uniref:F-box protein At3g25750 n=1 Tax=Spinacia oleracea TaxID=3562 RepID=A0A9R0KD21_SPIOL|nr:putative F-box protein At3g25750 [Spinacia oleracea]KNA22053.1 hypothetical protein SOVF_037570 [Spinacia oleracea]